MIRNTQYTLTSQVNEEVTRLVQSLRASLMGEDGQDPSADVTTHIANEVYAQDLMAILINHLPVLEFEVSRLHSYLTSTRGHHRTSIFLPPIKSSPLHLLVATTQLGCVLNLHLPLCWSPPSTTPSPLRAQSANTPGPQRRLRIPVHPPPPANRYPPPDRRIYYQPTRYCIRMSAVV